MPDFFELLSEYFWLVALGVSTFNYTRSDRQMRMSVSADKLSEARSYLRTFAIAGALPWIIMAVGQLTRNTPTIWYYFRPQDRNPFVLAWLLSTFALSCLFAYWVFLAKGVEKVIEFNLMAVLGQRSKKPTTKRMIKIYAALGVLILPVWVFMAVSMNVPLHH